MTMTATAQKTKMFYHAQVEQALQDCQEAGYQPLFMPQLADARINGTAPWNQWFSTPSIRATGKTKQGTAVVVYAHIPNFLSNPNNIKEAKEQGLVNYAARLSQDEFQRLVDAEDKQNVWVVDHADLKKAVSGRIKITDAIKHPQVIPFLGGQERAERYLPAQAQAYNTKTIGVWHSNDINDESPLARLLYLGYCGYGGLGGDDSLSDVGQFLGVRDASAEGAVQKIVVTPTLDQILRVSQRFVAGASRKEYEDAMRKLYKQ